MQSRPDGPETGTTGRADPWRPTLPARLRAGGTVLGFMATTRSVEVTRTLAISGCDFVIFDAEHTAIDQANLIDLVMATAGVDCYPIVRTPTADATLAKPALDVGVMGIAFPHVASVEDAENLVACTKYPNIGQRGVGPAHAARRWGRRINEYLQFAQEDTLAIAIIESADTATRLKEILQVPGLDVVLIAREDLAASMGHLGDGGHPDVVRMARIMEEQVQAAGIPLGCRLTPDADVHTAEEQGFQFIVVGSDMQLLSAAVQSRVTREERRTE